MFVNSRWRTVCLMAAMLVAFLTAAWGKEAPAPGDLRQPKATLTISGLLRADVRAQVDAAVRLLDDRGQAGLAGQVRTMLAEGRIVEGTASEGSRRAWVEGDRMFLRVAPALGAPGTPQRAADSLALALSLSGCVVALEDEGIFDRWGNLVYLAVTSIDQIRSDQSKVAENTSPTPRDRKAWSRSLGEMADLTDSFFDVWVERTERSDRDLAIHGPDGLVFLTGPQYRAWLADLRQEAVTVAGPPPGDWDGDGNRTGPRRIERGTTGQKTEGGRSTGSGDMNPSSGAPLPGSGSGAGGPVAP